MYIIIVLEWPIRIEIRWFLFEIEYMNSNIQRIAFSNVFELVYSKDRVFRIFSNSNIQKSHFSYAAEFKYFKNRISQCIRIRVFKKAAFFKYIRFRIFEICEQSKSFELSKKFREHNYDCCCMATITFWFRFDTAGYQGTLVLLIVNVSLTEKLQPIFRDHLMKGTK